MSFVNLTRIVIPTGLIIEETPTKRFAVRQDIVNRQFFSWRDVVSIQQVTEQDFITDYCANQSNLSKTNVRYNRGNGTYYRIMYRGLKPTDGPSAVAYSQEQYRAAGNSRPLKGGTPGQNSILRPVLDQGTACGSCYCFGTTEMISNRTYISTYGKIDTILSPWYVLNKCMVQSSTATTNVQDANLYCGGGDIGNTLNVIQNSTGIPTMADYPYPVMTSCNGNTQCSGPSGAVNLGQNNCNGGTGGQLYRSFLAHWDSTKEFAAAMIQANYNRKTQFGTTVPATPSDPMGITYWTLNQTQDILTTNMNKIMAHVYSEGPCVGGFSVFPDFFTYNSSNPYAIYGPTAGSKVIQGGHAILIVGWGTTANGQLYYEIQNSWGVSWGDQGFFYMDKGKNYVAIESNAMGILVGSDPTVENTVEYQDVEPVEPLLCNNTALVNGAFSSSLVDNNIFGFGSAYGTGNIFGIGVEDGMGNVKVVQPYNFSVQQENQEDDLGTSPIFILIIALAIIFVLLIVSVIFSVYIMPRYS